MTEQPTEYLAPVHRPLSVWVAGVPTSVSSTPLRPEARVVNDGDERAGARRLPKVAHGWRRTAIRHAEYPLAL
ncbi:hypothetical protein ACFWWN_01525, partial [Streptomyces sp. NPDC059082]|uniref:hypothetical protein n=1 Tax=Streptomyces sp. NPDC059082 TaxID=3346720 RepID=UPI003691C655